MGGLIPHRVKLLIVATATAAVLTGATAGPAGAAPIVCPTGQTAVHQNGHWYCQNKAGKPTGAGHHKGNGNN